MDNTNNIKEDDIESYANKRLNICKSCKYYKFYVCGLCGCFMPVKIKFKNSVCPIRKWTQEV